ncbi:hypothetical protein SUGI_0828440 [Cryptomeria japonica]|nr:hypothetical protein SUGI_0828440 [Cryptomeria japonica]
MKVAGLKIEHNATVEESAEEESDSQNQKPKEDTTILNHKDVRQEAAEALWNLFFDDRNRKTMPRLVVLKY